METSMGGKVKTQKNVKVQNKAPAPVQITAEQLLREAKERQLEVVQGIPKRKITDKEELQEYKLKQRKYFEDMIRKNQTSLQSWLRYAAFEAKMKEWQRARSVYERALNGQYKSIPLWIKYTEMEMQNGQVNHARNLYDRAVQILPRARQLWFKYVYMEELLGAVANCRQVFERWMEWEPEVEAWHAYINFELRFKEVGRARNVYESFVAVHHEVKNWVKYAKFEERHNEVSKARVVFERAVAYYGDDHMRPELFEAFAKFEERQKEYERARAIYKYAIDKIEKSEAQTLLENYSRFEKRFGNRHGIENVIVSKRKVKYENELKDDKYNYDTWFDYLRLSEEEGNAEVTRELYEKAISCKPLTNEKRHWRRYIYLWIYYALYEELVMKDVDRARDVYKMCLSIIPHKIFTFSKIWIMAAKLELRQKNVDKARKILGEALGRCPKDKLFNSYIEIEIDLREFDRCRKLYNKAIELAPFNGKNWTKYAELEAGLGDNDRAHAIFELAVKQDRLDMPEMVWKAYIEYEKNLENYDNVRNLYARLLQLTNHLKVWLSYTSFEVEVSNFERARRVFQEANAALSIESSKEDRIALLMRWEEFEKKNGSAETLKAVQDQQPKQVKKRRKVVDESGNDIGGWEEYVDYIFPEDEQSQPAIKLLNMARNWNKNEEESSSDEDSSDEDED